MQHIKNILAEITQNASKAKFYRNNQSIFLKYFDSEQQYEAMIRAGNFAKMSEVIKANAVFDFDKFVEWVRS